MNSEFIIAFNLKTPEGYENFARFCIGSNREKSGHLFHELYGTANVDDLHPLSMDLIEVNDGLPVNVKVRACDLHELGENCKHITRELFRWKVIDPDDK